VRITRLYLRNYRVYEEPLDLELPAGLVGIYGPNGAGKSVLLESILWCLFGRARTDKSEIRTAGVLGECVTEVEFEHEGHLYLVRRTISGANATVKAEAHADRLQVAEGVRDTRQYVQSVLGMDDPAFRASVFAEQKQLAAFSNQTPAERRKLVMQLLGITPLDAARDKARKDAKAARDDLERVRVLLPDLDELRAAAEMAAAEAELKAAAVESEETAAATAAAALTTAETRLADLEELRREHEALVAEGKAVRAEHDRAAAAIAELEKELAALVDAEAQLVELRPLAAGVDDAEARMTLLRAAVEAATALAAVPLPREPAPPDEVGCDAALAAAEAARSEVATTESLVGAARAERERAAAAATRSAELSGEGDCPLCGQELGDAFEQVQAHRNAELAEVDARLAELEARLVTARTGATEAEAAARTARAALKEAQQAWAVFERARDRREQLEATLATAVERCGGTVPTEAEVEELAATVRQSREAAAAAQRIEGRLLRRPEAERALDEERSRLGDAAGRREALLEKVRSLGFDAEQLTKARAAREEAVARAERARAAAQEVRLAAERAKGDAATAAARLADAQEQHAKLATLSEDARHLGRLSDLLNAFRTNVVSTIGPRLSAQAADLFAELTDREYDQLEVDPETYEIQIRDAGHAYDMSRFSGSEVDLANLALRVAISEHVRFQSGGAVGLLVLDEVFGPLDDDRKERMLLALERLRARFRQVLVVTHDNEIKEQLPGAIEVVKLPGRRATARVLVG
jgi:DNA repair protein SbcC/Rad50